MSNQQPVEAVAMVNHAVAAAAAGHRIFPAHHQRRHPLITDYFAQATTDTDQVRRWWKQWPDALIACRVPDDIVIVDIDPKHQGHTTWDALGGDDIASPCRHRSGRNDGGSHQWYKWPTVWGDRRPGTTRLDAWARERNLGHATTAKEGREPGWTAGIDLLTSKHRYTILPPSLHPATGQPYWWDSEDEPGDMPAVLVELCGPVERKPAPPPRAHRSVNGDETPADWFTANTTWPEILAPHGWIVAHGDGDSDGSLWKHPAATNDTSASINHGCLFVYSPHTAFEVTEPGHPEGYTRFRAHSILNHAGDMGAAARQLRTHNMPAPMLTARQIDPTTGEIVGSDPALIVADDSFHPVQLGPFLAGTVEPLKPTLLKRTDGRSLLYDDRVNLVFGDSGVGKSFLVAQIVKEAADDGRVIMVIDLEDNPTPLIQRLRQLGLSNEQIEQHVVFVNPDDSFREINVAALAATINTRNVNHVFIDSLGEAFAVDGVNENSDEDVTPWLRNVVRRIVTDTGIGVTLLDHITKSTDNPLHSSGTKRKRAAVTGASYRLDAVRALNPTVGGLIRVTCAKDRHGNYQRGAVVAEIEMMPGGHRIEVRPASDEEIKETISDAKRRAILDYLREHPDGANTRAIRADVGGRAQDISDHLEWLAADGFINRENRPNREQIWQYRRNLPTSSKWFPSGSHDTHREPLREPLDDDKREPLREPPETPSDQGKDSSGSQWFPVVPDPGTTSGSRLSGGCKAPEGTTSRTNENETTEQRIVLKSERLAAIEGTTEPGADQ